MFEHAAGLGAVFEKGAAVACGGKGQADGLSRVADGRKSVDGVEGAVADVHDLVRCGDAVEMFAADMIGQAPVGVLHDGDAAGRQGQKLAHAAGTVADFPGVIIAVECEVLHGLLAELKAGLPAVGALIKQLRERMIRQIDAAAVTFADDADGQLGDGLAEQSYAGVHSSDAQGACRRDGDAGGGLRGNDGPLRHVDEVEQAAFARQRAQGVFDGHDFISFRG